MHAWISAATGDIDDMWLRDSSVQMAIYLPRIEQHPALRRVIEGANPPSGLLYHAGVLAGSWSLDSTTAELTEYLTSLCRRFW